MEINSDSISEILGEAGLSYRLGHESVHFVSSVYSKQQRNLGTNYHVFIHKFSTTFFTRAESEPAITLEMLYVYPTVPHFSKISLIISYAIL